MSNKTLDQLAEQFRKLQKRKEKLDFERSVLEHLEEDTRRHYEYCLSLPDQALAQGGIDQDKNAFISIADSMEKLEKEYSELVIEIKKLNEEMANYPSTINNEKDV